MNKGLFCIEIIILFLASNIFYGCDSDNALEPEKETFNLFGELEGEWILAYTMKPGDGSFLMGTWEGTCCCFTKDSLYVYEYIEDHHFADGFSTYLYTDTIRENLEKYCISYVNPDSVILSNSIRLKYCTDEKYHKLFNEEYSFLFYRK